MQIPSLSIFFIVVQAAIGGRIGWLSTRAYLALAREMAENGFILDRAMATELYRKWKKDPESLVGNDDPEKLRTLKLKHTAAFTIRVKPWKLAYKIGLLAIFIAALGSYFHSISKTMPS